MIRIKTHPGEVLKEEFLTPLSITINKLSRDLDVPASRISDIVNERRDVSVDTALRLATYFGTTPMFWVNLQANHSLTKFQASEGSNIAQAVRPMELAAG